MPKKKKRTRRRQKWINIAVVVARKQKWVRYWSTVDYNDLVNYKAAGNRAANEIRKARGVFEIQLVKKHKRR